MTVTCAEECLPVTPCSLFVPLLPPYVSFPCLTPTANWEANKLYGCACDANYQGADCSLGTSPVLRAAWGDLCRLFDNSPLLLSRALQACVPAGTTRRRWPNTTSPSR